MWAWELIPSKSRSALGKSIKLSYNTVSSDNEVTDVTDVRPLGDLYQLRLCYCDTHDYERLSSSVTEMPVF